MHSKESLYPSHSRPNDARRAKAFFATLNKTNIFFSTRRWKDAWD